MQSLFLPRQLSSHELDVIDLIVREHDAGPLPGPHTELRRMAGASSEKWRKTVTRWFSKSYEKPCVLRVEMRNKGRAVKIICY